jgi:hypothetical protein
MRCNDAPDVVAILLASAKAAFDGALKSVGTRIRVKLRLMTPPHLGCEHTPCRRCQGAINKIRSLVSVKRGDIQQRREIFPIAVWLDGRHYLESTEHAASESAPGLKERCS